MHIFYCAGGIFGEVVGVFLTPTGCTGVSPVLSVRCAGGLATLSAHESGEHRTLKGPNMARGGGE